MILSKFHAITILCPTVVTGGPDALHQFSQSLNQLGCDAGLGYYKWDGHLPERRGDRLSFNPPAPNICLDAYAHYDPRPRREIPLEPGHLIVLPETLNGLVDAYRPASVAIWWLSVDNAGLRYPEIGDAAVRGALLARDDILHLHQSAYAREYLKASGLGWSHPLNDYTPDLFTGLLPTGPPAGRRITYNASKGAALAQSFSSLNPQFEFAPILPKPQMTQLDVRTLLRDNLVYVDFGHSPGRDHLPREAAASGAVVFIRRCGAGAWFEDYRLPEFYKFDDAEVGSGELAERIAAVLAAPSRYWTEQEPFRTEMRWEKAAFYDQVRRLLGRPPPPQPGAAPTMPAVT